jgi:hypothetical protein
VELNFAFELIRLEAGEASGQFYKSSARGVWMGCAKGVTRKHFDCVLFLTILGGALLHSINLTETWIIIIHIWS